MKGILLLFHVLFTVASAGLVKRSTVTEWDIVTVTAYTYVFETTAPAFAATAQGQSSSSTISIIPVIQSATSSSVPLPTLSATSSSASATQTSGSGTNNGLSDYAAPILTQHNLHRANHSVPALQWDDDLANLAMQIASTCVYAHSNAAGDGKYGQNIGAGAPPSDVPKMITDLMYNGEIIHYPGYGVEPDMSNFESWGHFSQIVWKGTESVGCYTNACSTLRNAGNGVAPFFTVCNYRPQGNMGGEYAVNVLAPLDEASINL